MQDHGPEPDAIRALLIEDNPDDAEILQELLDGQGCPVVQVTWESRLTDGLNRLAKDHFDVLLLDLSLPDSTSLDTLRKSRRSAPEIPILIMTGLADRELGLLALKEGAQDYLVKGRPSGESIHRAIRYAIERKKAEVLILESAMKARESAIKASESEAKLKLALSSSQIGVWSYSIDNEMAEWDEQVVDLFGSESEPLALSDFYELIHEEDRASVLDAAKSALKAENGTEIEFRIVRPDYSVHWIKVIGKTIFDSDGNPTKLTGILKQTTKDKEQEETARRLALLEQRQEFVAMLAHDLKTPVIGAQRILTHIVDGTLGQIPAGVKDVLSKICLSNSSVLHIINNIMDCYRLESNAESLEESELDFNMLISGCVDEMLPLAESNNITLTHKTSLVKPVCGDKLAMRRVIYNLIGNAVKFTPPGGRIELKAFDRDGHAVVQVVDNGIGIAPGDLENIFERFFQASSKYRAKGLGLGLYLCNKLLLAQNATITCKSQPSEGTTFELVLPYYESKRKCPILVIDDMEITRIVLRKILESLCFDVDVACSGAEGLQYARSHEYSAIFVDILMPEMDGYVTTKALRAAGVSSPIVAYSGISTPDGETLDAAGFNDFVQKPISIDQMRKLVNKWVDEVVVLQRNFRLCNLS